LIVKRLKINEKITKDIIKFNLKDEFVYKNVYFFKNNDKLYVYNSDCNKRFFIPEGLVLFYGIDKKDGIFIIKNYNYYNVIIKFNNELIDDFILEDIKEEDLKSLKYEYSLPIYDNQNYQNILEKGFKNFDYKILIQLWDLSFDFKNIKNKVLDSGFSFFIAVGISFIIIYGSKIYLESKISKEYEKLNQIRVKNKLLDEKLQKIKIINEKWKIVNRVINQKNIFYFLNKLAFYVKNKGRISYFRCDRTYLLFTIDTKDITPILTLISKDKDFQNISLVSSVNISKNIKRYRFEGTIDGIK